jgi:hypothetical protein
VTVAATVAATAEGTAAEGATGIGTVIEIANVHRER